MRVLITGSRDWVAVRPIFAALDRLHQHDPHLVIVHGAGSGADRIAKLWAIQQGVPYEPHPADWGRYGKAAGPIRNQQMVALGADLCLAFPLPQSRGTYDCMRRAREAGIPVHDYSEEAR